MTPKKTEKPSPAARQSAPRRAKTPVQPSTFPSETDVASRAYQLFVQRGGEHGHDQEDWLLAEQELRSLDQ